MPYVDKTITRADGTQETVKEWQSTWDGPQIDDGLGRIINGELDKLVGQAATSAQYAQAAERGVKDALANIPEGETPIINDLVTGGARMPLSAEMGKKLQTEKADAAATAAAMSNKVNVPQEIPGGSDLNECRTAGMHYVGYNGSSVLNIPTTTSAFSLFVEENNAWGDGVKQTFTPFTSPEIYCRVYYNGTWSRWDLLATSTPPQEYALPLETGYTKAASHACNYSKAQDGTVLVHIAIEHTSGILPTGYCHAASLPEGYRKAEIIGRQYNAGEGVYINPDGHIFYSLTNARKTLIDTLEFRTSYGPNALQSQVRMPAVRSARAAIQEEPVDRCMCVVDADGNYAEFVMVTITHDELGALYTVHYYDIAEGERLIDTMPPIRRPYAGADGFVRACWDFDAKVWCEDATAEEIAAWEVEHPAPEPVPDVPNETEQLKAQVAALEADKAERAELEAMASAIERGLSI